MRARASGGARARSDHASAAIRATGREDPREQHLVPCGPRRDRTLAGMARETARAGSVALVHDYLLVMRGAERTFAAIADCFPDAPIYTLLYDRDGTGQRFADRSVHTSYLQWLGIRQAGFRRLLPFFPRAVKTLPVQEHELVISSSSAFAHGVRPRVDATHVSYCHTPFRYAWHERASALEETPRYLRPAVRRLLDRVRRWDLAASRNVSHYIANSELTRERIGTFYDRGATVVHPPVDVDRYQIGAPEDFFLVVTEVVRHKRVEIALEAARRARQPIKIVGDGPDLRHLSQAYGSTAEFLGRVSDAELASLYARARALIVPNVEEFGIAAVEAQAAGRPVVAADAGGARETVIPHETGVLVPPGDKDALAEALRHTDFDRFSPRRIKTHAAQFSTTAFAERFRAEIARLGGAPRQSAATTA
jgi:glycosyltransferase involved in cell wall biosynthesis